MKILSLLALIGAFSAAFAESPTHPAADVQRDFFIAIIKGDQAAGEKLALPNPELTILFSQSDSSTELQKEAIAHITANPYRVLKVGEVFRLPNGGTISPTQEMEKKGWVIVANDTDPLPHMLLNSGGVWKVDAQGLIVARKAAAKARKK